MTLKEKLEIIDRWLIARRRIIAGADHMRIIDNGKYELMEPIGDVKGPREIFNIRLEGLSDDDLRNAVNEIKGHGLHAEWPNICSDKVCMAIHGKIPYHTFAENVAGIMTRQDMPDYPEAPAGITIKHVSTKDEFATWCGFFKDDPHGWIFYANGHMHFVEGGKLVCFIAYGEDNPAAAAAIIDDEGAGALEYFKMTPEYRQKEIALAICRHSIRHAFKNGMRFVVGYRYYDWELDSQDGYSLYDELKFPDLYREK